MWDTVGKDEGFIKCSQPGQGKLKGAGELGVLEMLNTEKHDHQAIYNP